MTPRTVTLPFPRRPKYGDAEITAATKLLREGRLSDVGRGPAIAALEDAFAALVDTTHALSFNSGTASLHAALHAVDVTPDQGVVMSPMTWVSAITAAFHAGSFPIFADLDPDSPNLDPAGLDTAHCSAVLVTHAWGVPAPMHRFTGFPVPVVEDCSHAHGARHQGRPVGSWGTAGCFSLQETKAVSGGEGGILTTSDRLVYERAMTLGHHPRRLAEELTAPELLPLIEAPASHKFRMPTLAAVIAHEQLNTLPARMRDSDRNLAHLTRLVENAGLPIAPVPIPADAVRGWYGTPFTLTTPVNDPAALHTRLQQARLPIRALYPDWLTTPLLSEAVLVERHWPHMRGRWTSPRPQDFPNYRRFRRQTVVLKIPDLPAPDYIEQVAAVLATTLRSS
ncbi:DegT/DnrJ/EryC1/StrS family aminotransferase [Streptomyces sp. SID3343]|uniref:DegT/DnrJ/EryC1/StrS family aminotransferase n=1 Tax=Streptomyces sp. SID3343 TaxID=2690260 RepID=UPI00136BA6AD|nr:DegT/DnrJ/EryC1/StrS family aminotransferase [Streptomyces sp. SID3343]MYW02316.1 hypothetical protein [Streptomyces sp. SID3343]